MAKKPQGSKNSSYRRMKKLHLEELKGNFLILRQDIGREFSLLMENKRLVIPYVSVVAVLIALFVTLTVVLNSRTSALHDEHIALYNENEGILSEINKYNVRYLEQIMNREFDKVDTNKRINSNFSYRLYVNSSDVTESVIYTKQDITTIELYEGVPDALAKTYSTSLLKDASMVRGGSLPANYIRVSCGNREPEIKVVDSGLNARLQVSFSGLEEGEIITIEVTYAFAQRMGLDSTIIEVIKR